ncbi:MAG: hypothetical protein JWO13_1813 [Acidobacteriales bacterium]|nr:hypothetical protein [Terriglobales bacterium]
MKIVAAVLALSLSAFAQNAKPQTSTATPAHEQSAKADAHENAKKDDDCCCKKMMKEKDSSGMKMHADKDEKEKSDSKTEKKSCR